MLLLRFQKYIQIKLAFIQDKDKKNEDAPNLLGVKTVTNAGKGDSGVRV